MGESAIKLDNVSVEYKHMDMLSLRYQKIGKRKKKFTALKNISLNINKGEIVGVIGSNGSGKSTLLKVIAGIFAPNDGIVHTYANTLSLLSIGVGFQKNLSGKDNILLSGMLQGFSKESIVGYMDEIIEFSGLGEFINWPVKTYSSGMYSKLAFSIATTLRADIILVDEILSVGDRKFRKKSYKKMKELIQDRQRTVMIVSHNLESIKELCNKVIWLQDGKIVEYGDVDDVILNYIKSVDD